LGTRKKVHSMAKKIDLVTALRIIEAAKQKAKELKVAMNIAVVDAGNNLVPFSAWTGPGWVPSTSP